MQWTGLSHSESVALLLVLIAAVLWVTEAVQLFVTSFILLLLELTWLLPSLEEEGEKVDGAIFLAPFFSNVILLFLGGFVLSTAFRKYQIDRLIAHVVLSRTGGRPRSVMAAVILVTAFLSMWMSNTATAAMMLGLSLPLVSRVDPSDPIRRGLPLAVAAGANLGGLGTPIGTPPNAIVVEALAARGTPIGFATWMGMTVPILVVLLVALHWLLGRMFPPKVERLDMDEGPLPTLSWRSLSILAVTGLTGLLWLTSGLHGQKTGTVALIPVVVFFGGRLLDKKDFQSLPWDVLILAGGGLSLGVAVSESGLGNAIVSAVPVQRMNPMAVVVAITLISALMTTFMSNTATANLLVPVVAGLSDASSSSLLLVVAYACSCTMILPVSTPPNAMVFSSGEVGTRDLVRTGLLVSAVALAVTAFFAPFWWGVFGL
jgi:sodium-dependent dicarboxylate transporter 2/3/5